jgi:cell division septation protein DedD
MPWFSKGGGPRGDLVFYCLSLLACGAAVAAFAGWRLHEGQEDVDADLRPLASVPLINALAPERSVHSDDDMSVALHPTPVPWPALVTAMPTLVPIAAQKPAPDLPPPPKATPFVAPFPVKPSPIPAPSPALALALISEKPA